MDGPSKHLANDHYAWMSRFHRFLNIPPIWQTHNPAFFMRQIGDIKEQEKARLFAAFLMTKGIPTKIEPEDGVWEVWVKDEDKLDEATAELEKFQAAPDAPQYAGAIQKAGEIQREEELRRRKIQQNIVKVSESRISKTNGTLTTLLIVISAIVALFTNLGHNLTQVPQRTLSFMSVSGTEASEVIQQAGGDFDAMALRLASIADFEVWRIVTPIFIHFGMFHIVFNMIWLFQFGRMIETRYGTFWFGMLVLMAAVFSNFAQGVAPTTMGGSSPRILGDLMIIGFGGMSGVVYGLFGFIWMKSAYDRASGLRIRQSTVFILLAWLFFCMTPMHEQMFGTPVANWAHGIGLVVGMIAGLLPSMNRNRES